MNILPKKKWHVRTSENIARVRKDEAQAADEARELERRCKLAEQEARTSLMRERAKKRMIESGVDTVTEGDVKCVGGEEDLAVAVEADDSSSVIGKSGHVNFFQNLEDGEGVVSTNKEHEEEKKKEQEEYEKKVGYLTYLGQDTEELTGEQVWWKKLPKDRLAMPESDKVKSAIHQKQKEFLDPLSNLKKYLKCDGVRLTMKRHEKKMEVEESKALNFEPAVKRKRRRSNSRSRSRERRKKKKRDDSPRHKKRRNSSSDIQQSRKSKKKKKRSKKRRNSSSSGSSSDEEKKSVAKGNLVKMRKERLERERVEREKANRLVNGEPVVEKEDDQSGVTKKNQKYSSQFNPECARQNKLDPNRKYWLE
eukprot:GFUD01021336.1.p1 GENE.GFUD01021336.1~~GFUD01021336.1.p1  ORF type:complete len:365 (+),score=149.04 GFUD01021336.1:43-1137(+)